MVLLYPRAVVVSPTSLQRYRMGQQRWNHHHPRCCFYNSSSRWSAEEKQPTPMSPLLTRTQVHRMRVTELRAALKDHVVGLHNMKRTQLVALLLDTLPRKKKETTSSSESSNKQRPTSNLLLQHRNPGRRRWTTALPMTAISTFEDTAEEEEDDDDSLQSPATISGDEEEVNEEVGDGTSASSAARTTPARPPSSIVLRAKGLVQRSLPGTGIAWSIAYLDNNNNNTTASATTTTGSLYYPTTRSIYEAEYSALILGLRHLLVQQPTTTTNPDKDDRRNSTSLTIETDSDVVYHQMTRWYPVEKPSLRPLVQTVRDLQTEWVETATTSRMEEPTVRYAFVSSSLHNDVHQSATQALQEQHPEPNTLRDDDPMQSFWDSYVLPAVAEEEVVVVADDNDDDEFLEQQELSSVTPSRPTTATTTMSSPPQQQRKRFAAGRAETANDTPATPAADPFAFLDETDYDDIATTSSTTDESSSPSGDNTGIDPSLTYILQFDGGARGNSDGVAGCGATLLDPQHDAVLWSGYRFLGESGITNNQAEYEGIVLGLTRARELGVTRIRCEGDSQLVIRQLLGDYKVKNARLRELHATATEAMQAFEQCALGHVARKDNYRADALANTAMDERMSHG